MFGDIYICIPSFDHVIRISEGDMCSLTDDDIANGYVDYIFYEIHSLEQHLPEVDGGMIMLEEPFRKKYKSTEECIPIVLDIVYCDENINYISLE